MPFILNTDHRPLVYMHNMTKQNSRILRTWNDLSEYDFQVIYRAGRNNIIADALSRLPPDGDSLDMPSEVLILPEGLQVLCLVPGGGDSIVDSLFQVLQQHAVQHNASFALPKDTHQLRMQLVDDIAQNLARYNLSNTKELRIRLKLARLPGQLPGEDFLQAFAHCYGLQVWVHHGVAMPMI